MTSGRLHVLPPLALLGIEEDEFEIVVASDAVEGDAFLLADECEGGETS